jgi:hypothetical protein
VGHAVTGPQRPKPDQAAKGQTGRWASVYTVSDLQYQYVYMSKRVGPGGRPGARHEKSTARTRPGTVANGLGPARPGSRAVLGPQVWHGVPGTSTARVTAGPFKARPGEKYPLLSHSLRSFSHTPSLLARPSPALSSLHCRSLWRRRSSLSS